jgi:hypothetical protein
MSRARQLADLLDSGGDVKTTNLDNTSEYVKPSSEPIGYISGLQGALDGKPDNSQLLTDVPTGAIFTDTVYSKPSSEPISYVSGLQGALDAKVDDTQVGTGANKIVQLNANGELPSVSAANLTDLPSTGGSAYFTDIGSYFTTI